MSIEARRDPVFAGRLPREAFVSVFVVAAIWEALSHLAPLLGIPAFAVPSLLRIAASLASVTPIDVAVTLVRVLAALVVSFVLGVAIAVAAHASWRLERYLWPLIRLLMAVP